MSNLFAYLIPEDDENFRVLNIEGRQIGLVSCSEIKQMMERNQTKITGAFRLIYEGKQTGLMTLEELRKAYDFLIKNESRAKPKIELSTIRRSISFDDDES